jgi:hypothetical protein
MEALFVCIKALQLADQAGEEDAITSLTFSSVHIYDRMTRGVVTNGPTFSKRDWEFRGKRLD